MTYFLSRKKYHEMLEYYAGYVPIEVESIIEKWNHDKTNKIVKVELDREFFFVAIIYAIILYIELSILETMIIKIGFSLAILFVMVYFLRWYIRTYRRNTVIILQRWLLEYFKKMDAFDYNTQLKVLDYIITYISLKTGRECGYLYNDKEFSDIVMGSQSDIQVNYPLQTFNTILMHVHPFQSIFLHRHGFLSDSDIESVINTDLHGISAIIPSKYYIVKICKCNEDPKKHPTYFEM